MLSQNWCWKEECWTTSSPSFSNNRATGTSSTAMVSSSSAWSPECCERFPSELTRLETSALALMNQWWTRHSGDKREYLKEGANPYAEPSGVDKDNVKDLALLIAMMEKPNHIIQLVIFCQFNAAYFFKSFLHNLSNVLYSMPFTWIAIIHTY